MNGDGVCGTHSSSLVYFWEIPCKSDYQSRPDWGCATQTNVHCKSQTDACLVTAFLDRFNRFVTLSQHNRAKATWCRY